MSLAAYYLLCFIFIDRCKDHDNGAISLSSLHRILSENPSYGGMIQNLKSHDSELGAFKREWFGGEQQLLLRAGDVVVMHSDLAHGGAPNLSDSIREMLYFRIKPSYGKIHFSRQSNRKFTDYILLF